MFLFLLSHCKCSCKRHFAYSAFTVEIKCHIARQHWHKLQVYCVYILQSSMWDVVVCVFLLWLLLNQRRTLLL